MTDTKYGKYFMTYQAKQDDIERGRTGITRVDWEAFES